MRKEAPVCNPVLITAKVCQQNEAAEQKMRVRVKMKLNSQNRATQLALTCERGCDILVFLVGTNAFAGRLVHEGIPVVLLISLHERWRASAS